MRKDKEVNVKKATPIIPAGRPGIPNPVDVHVGMRLREKRTILGLSQMQLADYLGITFQQIQKYERGTNRISESRLVDLSSVLETEIMYFFEDMPLEVSTQSPRLRSVLKETVEDINGNPLMKRETLELVRVYYKIQDPKQRKSVVNLCRSLASKKDD